MERFAKLAAELLNEILNETLKENSLPLLEEPVQEKELEAPPQPEFGDFAFPCFKLAKSLRKAPPVIAKELAEKLQASDHPRIKELLGAGGPLKVKPVGPYLNFIVSPQTALKALLAEILEGKDLGQYGKIPEKSRDTWIMEFSSPNIAKPFMASHLRSTALGAALARTASFRGYNTISINHLGDWGLQYGKLSIAVKYFGKDLPTEPTVNDLVDIYVKFHEEVEKKA
jgi:arginyl-tRNA synthetase